MHYVLVKGNCHEVTGVERAESLHEQLRFPLVLTP